MTYEQELDLKIDKYVKPYIEMDYYIQADLDTLVTKLREYFLETRVELLDIRVVAKIQDIFTELSPSQSLTSVKILEVDGKFIVNVTIDPHDPAPELTLEFITAEANLLHPGVEVRVVE